MPLGTQGKILAIIDKPQSLLAAWYLMRRGCEAIFLNTDSSNVEMLNTFMDKWYVKSDIITIDERLQHMKAYRKGKIYNNNLRVNTHGGNDYWESGILQPHKILMDLICIIHPEQLPGHQFVFYKAID